MNKKIDLTFDAISSIYQGEFFIEDGIITFSSTEGIPTEKQINKKIKELEDEYTATQYQRDRKFAYSKLNQDEMRFDDLENNTETWPEAIRAIKVKFPKPE